MFPIVVPILLCSQPVPMQQTAIRLIKTLKWLNGEHILEQERQAVQTRTAGRHHSSRQRLLANCQTDCSIPRSLSLECSAHVITQHHSSSSVGGTSHEVDGSFDSAVSSMACPLFIKC